MLQWMLQWMLPLMLPTSRQQVESFIKWLQLHLINSSRSSTTPRSYWRRRCRGATEHTPQQVMLLRLLQEEEEEEERQRQEEVMALDW